jgi:aminoglycoside 3-N-acetyltransferase
MTQETASNSLTRTEIVQGLRAAGLAEGDVVLVHSAMRTFGRIEGGGDAVVDALLEVLGPTGTLVVPTFTFAHEVEDDPIIDPANDPSEMGAITEAARRRPGAFRSTAYRHSVAAIGPRAEFITAIDPALAVFDFRSSFGVMLSLNAQILLFGVTYSSSTSHHFAEWVCQVPYRHTIPMTIKVRRPGGRIDDQTTTDYQPKSEGGSYYGTRGPDFNRLGQMLEDRRQAGGVFIGNSAVRRFRMRDLLDLAQEETTKDHNVFRTPEGEHDRLTPLDFGVTTMSPVLTDGAGRSHRIQWCVRDPDRLTLPSS